MSKVNTNDEYLEKFDPTELILLKELVEFKNIPTDKDLDIVFENNNDLVEKLKFYGDLEYFEFAEMIILSRLVPNIKASCMNLYGHPNIEKLQEKYHHVLEEAEDEYPKVYFANQTNYKNVMEKMIDGDTCVFIECTDISFLKTVELEMAYLYIPAACAPFKRYYLFTMKQFLKKRETTSGDLSVIKTIKNIFEMRKDESILIDTIRMARHIEMSLARDSFENSSISIANSYMQTYEFQKIKGDDIKVYACSNSVFHNFVFNDTRYFIRTIEKDNHFRIYLLNDPFSKKENLISHIHDPVFLDTDEETKEFEKKRKETTKPEDTIPSDRMLVDFEYAVVLKDDKLLKVIYSSLWWGQVSEKSYTKRLAKTIGLELSPSLKVESES